HGAADAVSEDLHGMAPAANAGQGRRELASLVGGALAAMLLRAGPTRSRLKPLLQVGAAPGFRRSGFSRDGFDASPPRSALKPLLQVGAAPGFRRSGFSRDAFDASPTRSRLKPLLQAGAAPGFRRSGFSRDAFSMRAPPDRG